RDQQGVRLKFAEQAKLPGPERFASDLHRRLVRAHAARLSADQQHCGQGHVNTLPDSQPNRPDFCPQITSMSADFICVHLRNRSRVSGPCHSRRRVLFTARLTRTYLPAFSAPRRREKTARPAKSPTRHKTKPDSASHGPDEG